MTWKEHGFHHQPYSQLFLVPIGAELQTSSTQHSSKSLLRDINGIVQREIETWSFAKVQTLSTLTGLPHGVIPLASVGEHYAYSHMIQPDYLLWSIHKPSLKLSLTHHFETKHLYILSEKQLQDYVIHMLHRYVFAAQLIDGSKKKWKDRARSAYSKHPFIELAARNQERIEAVEKLNRSMLIGAWNSPEDVAFWRQRVDIVLHPYRLLPVDARYSACSHPYQIQLDDQVDGFQIHCSDCQQTFLFHPLTKEITLPHEVNLPQAIKRIDTLERQFNQLALQTPRVIRSLQKLQQLKVQFGSELDNDRGTPFSTLLQSLQYAHFPEKEIQPTLYSLQDVELATIDSLKLVRPYLDKSNAELENLLETEKESHVDLPSVANATIHFSLRGHHLYAEQVDVIIDFLAREPHITFHLMIQLLKGEPTHKIRELELHHTPLFGLLKSWPKKFIPQAIKSFW